MQSFLLSKKCFVKQSYSLFCMKNSLPLASFSNTAHVRQLSIQPSNIKNSGTLFKNNIIGSQLLRKQININSWSNGHRYLSSLGAVNITEDAPKNVIDLTDGSNQELVQTAVNLISQQATSEVSIAALNLGSNYTPIGWCIHYLDLLHSVFPWWGAIAIGTVILRLSMFPLVISTQRNATKLNELLPQQAILKEKMNQARAVGDNVEFAKLANESHTLFKRHNINPIKSMLAPLAQLPVFLTFFLTLRRCADYPVESFKTGGLAWFSDLSIPDPYLALPLITSLTLWATLEISFRAGLNPNQTVVFKYGARIIPLITFIFTYHFSAAILTYWCTNNMLSIIQAVSLRQPAVRDFLNIPQLKVNPMQLDVNKKSFKTHFKETIENAKINKLMEERKTIDEITFKKAGIGPLQKTYKHDPTRVGN